jgi:hypothetical protein
VLRRGRLTLLAHNLLIWSASKRGSSYRRRASPLEVDGSPCVTPCACWHRAYVLVRSALARSDAVVAPHDCDLSPIRLNEKVDPDEPSLLGIGLFVQAV